MELKVNLVVIMMINVIWDVSDAVYSGGNILTFQRLLLYEKQGNYQDNCITMLP
jgi:hypothetical protein